MSQFPKVDTAFEAATKARKDAEATLKAALPVGSTVAIKSGPEFIGRFEVLEYPPYGYSQLAVKNLDSGQERQIDYARVQKVD
ncbi:hypothetical protein [Salinicola halophilus]|uniref:hypothetical protein n=1 Tax=Salinicola halophilus TaxID=184065 RepID=UPI000DA11BA7|nr:hypothetical protein [Salinicola halophilus]